MFFANFVKDILLNVTIKYLSIRCCWQTYTKV